MRKLSTTAKPSTATTNVAAKRGVTSPAPRVLNTKLASKPVAGKPSTAPLGTAAALQAATSNVASAVKRAITGKPTPATAATPALPAATTPAVAPVSMHRGLARDARTIVAAATNFEHSSDRDGAYLRFFGAVCRKHGGRATLANIRDAGTVRDGKSFNPFYAGSAKATDAGAINRAVKAGHFTFDPAANAIVPTALALALADYKRDTL